MSDHVFDFRIVKALINYKAKSSVVLAVDRREPLSGDTKVLEKGGKIVGIGKDIKESNSIDVGIFLCSLKVFSYIEEALREGNEELTAGIAKAAETKMQRYLILLGLEVTHRRWKERSSPGG